MEWHRPFLVLACVVIVFLAASPSADAQQQGPVRTAQIHWQDVPLRDAISRLETAFGTNVFLDRRIDPTQRVSAEIEASSAEDVLDVIGRERGWGVERIGRVVYVGPPDVAQSLAALTGASREKAAQVPASQRAALTRRRTISWPRLAEPRDLVTSLVERAGWKVANAERIPHDLWPAGELPSLTLGEQLTLLLIGFELSFSIDAAQQTISIEPISELPRVARRELEGAGRAERETGANQLGRSNRQTSAPDGTKRSVRPSAANTRQVYSLRVEEKPVGAVVRELGRRLNWPIEFDEKAIGAAGLSLEARVTFAVTNVDQDGLLRAVLQPAGLAFRRDGNRIVIVPRR